MKIQFLITTIAASLMFSACNSDGNSTQETTQEVVTETTLASVIAHERRAKHQARDQFRHPKETLEFFEVGPGKTVLEIWPGWYSDIIAPYLKAHDGKYVAALIPDSFGERYKDRNAAFKVKYSNAEIYGDVDFGSFAKDAGAIYTPESADVVLTFRNVHNWMKGGYAEQAFDEFYAVLKPGGILGVVEHRLPETATQDPQGKTGYVQESYMKALAEAAGFEFVASSEVNANPKDTADHPVGVWTLPPRSRSPKEGSEAAKDFNAELYKNIGESDRATLKFRKPL